MTNQLDIVIKTSKGASIDAPFFIALKKIAIMTGCEVGGLRLIIHDNLATTKALKLHDNCLIITGDHSRNKKYNGLSWFIKSKHRGFSEMVKGFASSLSGLGICNLGALQGVGYKTKKIMESYENSAVFYMGYLSNTKDNDIIIKDQLLIAEKLAKLLKNEA